VEAVGVEAHRHVALVSESEGVVDQVRIGAVVLVDLEADRAGLEQRLERGVVHRSGVGLEADVDRPGLEAAERPLHRRGRFLEPARDQGRDAARERRRHEVRADRVDVAVDPAGRGQQAVARDRRRVRSDRQVDALADAGIAGPPDAHDPAVLDPDVGLDDPDRGVDDDGAEDDGVELGRPRVAALRQPDPQVLGVAPDRLVTYGLAVLLDPDPEVRVAQADPVARRGAEPRPLIAWREAGHTPSPRNRTRVTVRVSPGAHRSDAPAGRSRRNPSAS
jgi:hypothetical protein